MSLNRTNALSWLILLFAAVNVIFLGGKRRAFGEFIATLSKHFPEIPLTELNWIGDSYAAFGYMSSSLSTATILYFNRRYGLFQIIGAFFILASCISSAYVPNPHWLFLTHTLLHGIGSSLVISIVGLVVNEHFGKSHPYHILATTLVSGGSVAAIFFIYLFAFLIKIYHWRMALIILGGIYFIVMGSAAFVFRRSSDSEVVSERRSLSCPCSGVSKRQVPLLILWFIDRVMTSVVTYGILLNMVHFIHRKNPDLVKSSILTTLFAAGEGSTYLIGAIITALTRNFFKNRLRYILLVTSLTMSVSLILLGFNTHNILMRRMLCFCAGFSLGPSITFLFPAGEELTQLPGHIAYPFSLGGMGFGMLISPLLTAKIAEVFKFKWFFLVQGGLIFIKFICLLIIIVLLRWYKIRDRIISRTSSTESLLEANLHSNFENSNNINDGQKTEIK